MTKKEMSLGGIPDNVGFSVGDHTGHTIEPMSQAEKHQQLINLKRMQLEKSTRPRAENMAELKAFEMSLINTRDEFYDIQTC